MFQDTEETKVNERQKLATMGGVVGQHYQGKTDSPPHYPGGSMGQLHL